MQWLDSYKTPDSLHLHHNTKNAPFLQTKGPTISKMDIYFCPFFWSEPISFSDLRERRIKSFKRRYLTINHYLFC